MRRCKVLMFAVCILLLNSCEPKETINFFASKIEHESLVKFYSHSPDWLSISGLDEIYYTTLKVSGSEQEIRNSLNKLVPLKYDVDQVIAVYAYSTNRDTSQVNVSISNVHALGLVRQENNDIYLDYLEKRDSTFILIPELTGKVNGGINMDDLRLFHFASTEGEDLPLISTIFEFQINSTKNYSTEIPANKSIGDAMLLNMELNKGMNTLDIYGDNFYAAMMVPVGPGGIQYCGGSEECGSGSRSDSCIKRPAGFPPADCFINEGGGCFNAVLNHELTLLSASIPKINLLDLYDFKDSFLLKYAKGRKFVAYMYLIGRYMKMDVRSMDNYLQVTIAFQEAIQKIKGKDDSIIIFDEKFVALFRTFITNHRDVKEKRMNVALANLTKDLNRLEGLNRKQFFEFLEE